MVKKNELEKDKNEPENKKGWKIVDAIFSAGIFRLFYDSEKARKDNNDKKFKKVIYESLIGIVFTALLFFVLFLIL